MVYADWNRDGDFDDAGESNEIGYLAGIGDVTNTITVPSNAVLGQTLLRVINRKNSYAPACGNYPVGETEDYLITLKTVDPASITTYSWAGPASQQSGNTWTIANSSLTDAGSYSLTVTNTFGCSTSTSHDVVVANPQIDFGQVVTDQEAPFSLQLTPGTFQAYSWSNGSSANELNISEFGTYSLTVSDYSCLDSASITLNEVQYIPLEQGWSMFSTYINQTNNIADVMSAITNSIFLVKNNSGQVYWPAMTINNINNMVVGQGYQAKMSTAETLRIEGISVDPENSPIFLNAGINTIGMLRHYPVSVTDLFYSVIQDLVYVKLNSGLVYLPQYQVNQVVQLTPDDGFKVMMLQSGTITYPANYPDGLQKEEMLILSPVHYPEVLNTGSGMTLVLPKAVVAGLLQYGDEVAVYTANNLLVGSAVYTGETMAMPVWGQDDTQQQKSGLSTTEPFTLEVYNQQTGLITRYEHVEYELGDGRYHENSLAVVKTLNLNLNLNLNLYPNPATDYVQVNLSLPEAADARIELFNAGGQLLQSTIIQGNKGVNQFKLNLKSYSSGNYILRVFTLNSTEEASFLVRN
jgi:hypothetical protein